MVLRGKILENKKKEAEKRGWRDRRDRVMGVLIECRFDDSFVTYHSRVL